MAVRVPENVFQAVPNSWVSDFEMWKDGERLRCLQPLSVGDDIDSFNRWGGICDETPGSRAFKYIVNGEAINNSGVALRVPAVNLETGSTRWWKEDSPSVVEGCQASGSISPLVFPLKVDGEVYIDGGFAHNTPVLKALQEGIRSVIVIMLNPGHKPPGLGHPLWGGGCLGMRVLGFELDFLVYKSFVQVELRDACEQYPSAKIMGYVPETDVGGLTDFYHNKIVKMQERGYEATASPPHDLCKFFNLKRFSRSPAPAFAASLVASGEAKIVEPIQANAVFLAGGAFVLGLQLSAYVAWRLVTRSRNAIHDGNLVEPLLHTE
jgi:hypothetical protein